MKDTKDTIDKEYTWDGDWEGPGEGAYFIMENNREMEPGEVIDYIERLQDFLVQGQELKELREFKHKVLTALNDRDDWDDLAGDLMSEL